jgi:hypothetical protein
MSIISELRAKAAIQSHSTANEIKSKRLCNQEILPSQFYGLAKNRLERIAPGSESLFEKFYTLLLLN